MASDFDNSVVIPPDESLALRAVSRLSYVGANQAAAYREHASVTTSVLGPDVESKLSSYIRRYATNKEAPTILVLTGNAGTGKTALAQVFCESVGAKLPLADKLAWLTSSHAVIKDLSGIPTPAERANALLSALHAKEQARVIVCANEGMLRLTLSAAEPDLLPILDKALISGAAFLGKKIGFINLNRQRVTSVTLWSKLLDYLTREDLWIPCKACPNGEGLCPPIANARALRLSTVREALRFLLQFAAGSMTITLRDTLATLSWLICGNLASASTLNCGTIKARFRDLGGDAFDARAGLPTLAVGEGLPEEAIERTPILGALRRAGLGIMSNLHVDGWLRDDSSAPPEIKRLLSPPSDRPLQFDARFRTEEGTWTFAQLGEVLSTSVDDRVGVALEAMVDNDALGAWRRTVFFFAGDSLGGIKAAAKSLTKLQFFAELLDLSTKCAHGHDTATELVQIIKGLNVLVTGYAQVGDGLIIPDSACLFSRDPGSFVPPEPCVIHAQVQSESLTLQCPDRGRIRDLVDVDDIEVELALTQDSDVRLVITPMMYEAIRQADVYSNSIGQGDATMSEIRDFYGRLSSVTAPPQQVRVAEFRNGRGSLVSVRLPNG